MGCREDNARCSVGSEVAADRIDFCGALAVHDRTVKTLSTRLPNGWDTDQWRSCYPILRGPPAVHDQIDGLLPVSGCSAAGDGFMLPAISMRSFLKF
ncbi:hypothetical protein ACLOJK_028766 [Asimina triloba]